MTQGRTVLVTGASGFVGRATVAALRESGWRVALATRSPAGADEEDSVYLDLDDPASIMALSQGPGYAAIVHLGARIGWSGETESDLLMPNVLATGLLIELANHWNARFVFASAAILHGACTSQIDEQSQIRADTAYGKSKWLAEQLFCCLRSACCILRISGVFGADGPEHLGLNRAISGAEKGEAPMLSGSGAALRNYIYVKDVGQAIAYVLERQVTGTHLLAGSETISVSGMLQILCDVFLPGQQPGVQDGAEASDQVITASTALPPARSFRAAVADMHSELRL